MADHRMKVSVTEHCMERFRERISSDASKADIASSVERAIIVIVLMAMVAIYRAGN